ncbi:hypothetical protein MNV49_007430 [Pseudohyphozyma bogoriensis]|nr:hypothetical protein MNV49_007430 [Pseudohyphozyma bogoriensis]
MADNNPFNTPIDSLPYYDRDLDEHPELRHQINQEIAVELRSILPKTTSATPANLSHLEPARPLPTSSFLASELARVQSKKPIPANEGLDTKRYAMPAPPAKEKDNVEAWQKAYDSSLAQLEHQRLRTLNGTLLSQLGANAWRVQNFAMENTVDKVEREGEEVRKAVEEVNRDRKRSQEQGGEILSRMEKKWTELVSGNMSLEIGCMTL